MHKIAKVTLISFTLLISACVTGTRNVTLELPTSETAKASVGSIQIVNVIDSRVFEQKPSSPNIPSSKADIGTLSDDTKATLIGRQRNGYGGAMGDVALPEGSTIQDEVINLIGAGLKNQGYVLSDNSDNKLNIDINKFWGWMVPSFVTIGFESEVSTTLSLTKGGSTKTVTIEGFGNNEGQVASNANWALTFRRAFEDFLSNMDSSAEELGL